MSNAIGGHATSWVPVQQLKTGEHIRYYAHHHTVAEVLPIQAKTGYAVVAIDADGQRVVLLYNSATAMAELILQ